MSNSHFIGIATALFIFAGGLNLASANANPPADFRIDNQTWTHHSSGIRSYNFVDVYQCVLYLPKKNKPTNKKLIESVENLDFPVAIRIKILTSMLPDKMPEDWRQTIESEVTGKAFHRFQKGFSSLDEGDILLFLFSPGEGTRLLLNDKLMFKDPGPGLMQGLLEQWMGSHPISEDLKQALIEE